MGWSGSSGEWQRAHSTDRDQGARSAEKPLSPTMVRRTAGCEDHSRVSQHCAIGAPATIADRVKFAANRVIFSADVVRAPGYHSRPLDRQPAATTDPADSRSPRNSPSTP